MKIQDILGNKKIIEIENDKILDLELDGNCFNKLVFLNCTFGKNDIKNGKCTEIMLSNTRIQNTIFKSMNFSDCCLQQVEIQDCKIQDCYIEQLNQMDLSGILKRCELDNISLENQRIKFSKYEKCNINNYSNKEGVFDHCEMIESKYENAVFNETAMWGGAFVSCTLCECVF